MDTTHKPLHLDKWNMVEQKVMNIPTTFIWITILFDKAFKYGDGANFLGYVNNAEPLCVEFWILCSGICSNSLTCL
jgi:hypothetical protein